MLHRLSRTLREIHRLSREVPVACFQDAAFEAMKELVRFDTGYWGGGREPVEAVVMHYQHLHQLPVEMNAAFEKVKSHPKHIEVIFRCVTNAGQAQAFDVRESGTGDFYTPYGIDQLVTLYQHDADLGLYHVISLFRSGEERFTEPERLLFESAVPHLLDARRESKLLHLSGANRDACPLTPAAALLDKEGVVHFARPAFVDLMRREWPEWRGPFVPEAMRRVQEGSFAGEQVAVRFTPQNNLFLAVARVKGPLDRLTARELEVAKQLARGASHKEIARDLAIAPATARNHIASIHAKLGNSKVAQITTLLMNEGWL
ncbi:MAG: helix-turn-helix transcriptional regulator [Gallionella sp.]|nr:helix-turn-helix transcriptional regulator [Gallionella sp.]